MGEYGTDAAQSAYDRLIAEWLANGRQLALQSDLSVNELLVAYLRHAREFYGIRRTYKGQLSRIKVARCGRSRRATGSRRPQLSAH